MCQISGSSWASKHTSGKIPYSPPSPRHICIVIHPLHEFTTSAWAKQFPNCIKSLLLDCTGSLLILLTPKSTQYWMTAIGEAHISDPSHSSLPTRVKTLSYFMSSCTDTHSALLALLQHQLMSNVDFYLLFCGISVEKKCRRRSWNIMVINIAFLIGATCNYWF